MFYLAQTFIASQTLWLYCQIYKVFDKFDQILLSTRTSKDAFNIIFKYVTFNINNTRKITILRHQILNKL